MPASLLATSVVSGSALVGFTGKVEDALIPTITVKTARSMTNQVEPEM